MISLPIQELTRFYQILARLVAQPLRLLVTVQIFGPHNLSFYGKIRLFIL